MGPGWTQVFERREGQEEVHKQRMEEERPEVRWDFQFLVGWVLPPWERQEVLGRFHSLQEQEHLLLFHFLEEGEYPLLEDFGTELVSGMERQEGQDHFHSLRKRGRLLSIRFLGYWVLDTKKVESQRQGVSEHFHSLQEH